MNNVDTKELYSKFQVGQEVWFLTGNLSLVSGKIVLKKECGYPDHCTKLAIETKDNLYLQSSAYGVQVFANAWEPKIAKATELQTSILRISKEITELYSQAAQEQKKVDEVSQ